MKLLFVKPPFNQYSFVKYFAACEPLELEVLCSSLNNEHDVSIVDLRYEERNFKSIVEELKPDVIGFTSLTMEANSVIRLAKQAKNISTEITTCVGGEHATLQAETFLNCSEIDFVFKYDALTTFPVFLNELRKNRESGKSIKSMSRVQFNTSINDDIHNYPLPQRSLCKKYFKHYTYGCANPVSLVQMSSGCSYNCSFCSIPARQTKFRNLAIDRVLKDIEATSTKDLLSIDANALNNISQAKQLYTEIAKCNFGKRIMISCRSDSIVRHPEILDVLASANVSVVAMGLESLDDTTLRSYDKINTVNNNLEAVKLIHSHGMLVRGNFIIDQSFLKNDFLSLVDNIIKAKIEFPSFQILTPLPGTPYYEEVKSKIIEPNLDFFDLSHSVLPTKLPFAEFHQEFQTLFDKCYGWQRMLWLTTKIPLSLTLKGLNIALKSHLNFSYNKHNHEIEYTA
jgi:radical SAM superfamily enzyme YgiQ (UPF0313 family)